MEISEILTQTSNFCPKPGGSDKPFSVMSWKVSERKFEGDVYKIYGKGDVYKLYGKGRPQTGGPCSGAAHSRGLLGVKQCLW